MHRSTDTEKKMRFRSDRFFRSEGHWYFSTREGTAEGPYGTREEAHAALTEYLLSLGLKPGDVWSLAGDNR